MYNFGEIDINKKPEKIKLFVAKPDKTIIAKLPEAYEINNKISLGDINTLSFSVPYQIDIRHKLIENPHIDILKHRYLIKAVLNKTSEWYMITGLNSSADDNAEAKKINTMSLAYELKDKIIRGYSTEESGPKTCTQVLTDALSDTLWTVGTIDTEFDVVRRSFSVSSKTALDFVIEIAQTFQGVILYDTNNRTVSILKEENIGQNKGLKFSYGKYLKTINQESTTEEMTTRLKVYGKDDLSINRLNPTGTNYIEDFSYFMYPFNRDENKNILSHSYYMSDGLCNAIFDYNLLVESKKDDFSSLVSQKETKRAEYDAQEIVVSNYQTEVNEINDIIDVQQSYGTYNSISYAHTGGASTKSFTLKGATSNKKHAVLMMINNISGLTITYKLGTNSPVTKSLSSGNWTVVSKESLSADTTVKITITGNTNTNVKIVSCEILDYEYNGVIYEGAAIVSNGANNSVLTSTDPETSWRSVSIGDTVLVENGLASDYQLYGQPNSDFVGYVKSVDISSETYKITLDRKLNAGTYVLGYRITNSSGNDNATINKYCLDYKTSQLNSAQADLDNIQNNINIIDSQIQALQLDLAIENNFTSDQIRERNMYIIEKEWSDQNYVDDKSLYDDALEKFEKIKEPQTVINIDIVNFLEIVECQRDWDKLSIGDTVTIKYERLGINVKAKIIDIDFNHESGEIKITIANVIDIKTNKEKFIDTLYKSASTSTTVDMNKFKWDQTVTDLGEVGDILNNVWDAAKREILAGTEESVVINGRGITLLDKNEPNKFIRLMHSAIGITDDNGENFDLAMTISGLVAERLYGRVLLGNNLIIGDSDGILNFLGPKGIITDRNANEVMKFGLYDGTTTLDEKFGIVLQKFDASNNITHKVIMDRDDGFKIQKKSGSSFEDIMWIDTQGNLNLKNLIASGSISTPKLTVANIDINDLIYNQTSGLRSIQGWIQNGMLEIGSISADKIKTNELIVGTNISMGPNATIAWSKVTGTPSFALSSDLSSYVTNTALTTKLGQDYVITGKIYANQITAGTLTGFTIQTATTGSRIVMNSSGLNFYGSDGTTAVISINTSNGSASFSGNITSSATISGSTITGANITGGTVTGATVSTLTAGSTGYVQLSSGYADITAVSRGTGVGTVFKGLDIGDGSYQIYNPRTTSPMGLLIGSYSSGKVYGEGAWIFEGSVDFSSATVTGITAKFG